ncbi:MAG TPA: hypothetical protein GXZ95_04605 [Mollicutes bacterium]|nr:hypothetical protein [Mollicutes bacterium]
MHNEYITLSCIRDVRDKLLLLKYENVDITEIRKVLYELTLDLMNQCYNHVTKVDQAMQLRSKNYNYFRPFVEEQLKDMDFIKEKFAEYNYFPGIKTKKDLLTYVLAFQIPAKYFNEFLYSALYEALKKDYDNSFWEKYYLNQYNLNTGFTSDFVVLKNTKEEFNTGRVNISLDNAINIIDKYTMGKEEKLILAKQIGNTLDNYYNKDFPPLNNPYKDYIIDLADHINVYQELEKSNQKIKRK